MSPAHREQGQKVTPARFNEGEGGEIGWEDAVREYRSHRGATLLELSTDRPTLVVFLRHAGCAFSRVALHDLGKNEQRFRHAGVRLAVVHMSDPMTATLHFEKYGLGHVHRFNDPQCELYRAVGLGRLRLADFMTWRVWWRGLVTALWQGHGIGSRDGDVLRAAGAFLLDCGVIVASSRPDSPADPMDYIGLVQQHARQLQGTECDEEHCQAFAPV